MFKSKAHKEFGTWLESQRNRCNMTRSQLAKKIGYSNLSKGAQTVKSWEKGDAFPNDKYCEKIKKALNISAQEWAIKLQNIESHVQKDVSFGSLQSRIHEQTKKDLILNHNLLMNSVDEILQIPNWRHIHLPGLDFGMMYFAGATTVQLGSLLNGWKERTFSRNTEKGEFYILSGGGSPLSGKHKFVGFYEGTSKIHVHRNLLTGLGSFVGPIISQCKRHNLTSSQWSLPQMLSQIGVYISNATIYHHEVEIGTYNFTESILYWKDEKIQFPLQKEDAYSFHEQNRIVTEEWGPATDGGTLIIGDILTGQFGAWQGERWDIEFHSEKWTLETGALLNPQKFPEITWDMDIPPLVQEWIAQKHITEHTDGT